jgi:hypothetical protein
MGATVSYTVTKQCDHWTIEVDGRPVIQCRARLTALRTVRDALRLLARDAAGESFGRARVPCTPLSLLSLRPSTSLMRARRASSFGKRHG